jgi:hypothetical protein
MQVLRLRRPELTGWIFGVASGVALTLAVGLGTGVATITHARSEVVSTQSQMAANVQSYDVGKDVGSGLRAGERDFMAPGGLAAVVAPSSTRPMPQVGPGERDLLASGGLGGAPQASSVESGPGNLGVPVGGINSFDVADENNSRVVPVDQTAFAAPVSRIVGPGEGLNQFADQSSYVEGSSRITGPGESLNQYQDTKSYNAGADQRIVGPGEGMNQVP